MLFLNSIAAMAQFSPLMCYTNSLNDVVLDSIKINFSGLNISQQTGWQNVNGSTHFPGTATLNDGVSVTSTQTYTYGYNGYTPNVYPDSISKSLLYKSDSIVVNITGLTVGAYYNFDILCSRATTGTKYSHITMGAAANFDTVTVQTVNNTTLAHFDSLLSDGSGAMKVKMVSTAADGSGFLNAGNFLNAIVISY